MVVITNEEIGMSSTKAMNFSAAFVASLSCVTWPTSGWINVMLITLAGMNLYRALTTG